VPRRLTDADVALIREALERGRPARDVAAEFGISAAYARRIRRGAARARVVAAPGVGPAVAAVRAFVDGLELDAAGLVLAEAALAVAAKLDAVRESETATAAAAAPQLARALVEVVAQLRVEEDDGDDWLSRIQRSARAKLAGDDEP
jgi:hypothetical protein